MLKQEITTSRLFIELAPIIERMDLKLVDAQESMQRNSLQVRLVIKAVGRITNIDDCSRVHKLVGPRLEVLSSDRDLNLEVSTPGLQRNFKDAYEFTLFKGEHIKLFLDDRDDWILGTITEADEKFVTFTIDSADPTEENNTSRIPYEKIRKAKLDVVWKEKK